MNFSITGEPATQDYNHMESKPIPLAKKVL